MKQHGKGAKDKYSEDEGAGKDVDAAKGIRGKGKRKKSRKMRGRG